LQKEKTASRDVSHSISCWHRCIITPTTVSVLSTHGDGCRWEMDHRGKFMYDGLDAAVARMAADVLRPSGQVLAALRRFLPTAFGRTTAFGKTTVPAIRAAVAKAATRYAWTPQQREAAGVRARPNRSRARPNRSPAQRA
jgi:hypothetical protein